MSAPSPTLQSGLYTGTVQHRRTLKADHKFRYPLFMVYLDLEEIEAAKHKQGPLARVMPEGWLWKQQAPAVVSYWRHNYLPSAERNLSEAVRLLVKQRSGYRPRGPIRMLTHLSYFGYCFNPATVFYCFHPDGVTLDCVVVEVTNTPWKERYAYVLTENLGTPRRHHYRAEKVFHVSPFFELDHHYDWYLTTPEKYLSLYIRNTRQGEQVFDATLSLQRQPLTTGNLLKTLAKFPCMTAQVWAGIHWEATKLLIKNVGYHAHPLDYKKERGPHHVDPNSLHRP